MMHTERIVAAVGLTTCDITGQVKDDRGRVYDSLAGLAVDGDTLYITVGIERVYCSGGGWRTRVTPILAEIAGFAYSGDDARDLYDEAEFYGAVCLERGANS